MKKRNIRRGFSLMEAVIAITVITIVSATALVTTTRSNNFLQKETCRQWMYDSVDDVVECFSFSWDATSFKSALALSSYDFKQTENVYIHPGTETVTMMLENTSLFRVIVVADFYDGGASSLWVGAYFDKDNTVKPYIIQYNKGA